MAERKTIKQMRRGETGYVTSWTEYENIDSSVSSKPAGTSNTLVVRTLFGFRFVGRPITGLDKFERFAAWFDQGRGRWMLAQLLILGIVFAPVFIGAVISNLLGVGWPLTIGLMFFAILLFGVLVPGMLDSWRNRK